MTYFVTVLVLLIGGMGFSIFTFQLGTRAGYRLASKELSEMHANEIEHIISDVDAHPEFIDDLWSKTKEWRETAAVVDEMLTADAMSDSN